MPAPPMAFAVTLSSTRASAWTESATNRLMLDGDVTVQLGPYEFAASRALIWLEPVRVSVNGIEQDADQIALYLSDVIDLRAAIAGVGTQDASPQDAREAARIRSADRLLITAIITGGNLTLHADDLREDRPLVRPQAEFVAEGEARLARYLVSLTGGTATATRRDPSRPGEALLSDSEAFELIDDPRYTDASPPANTGRVILPQQGTVNISAPSVAMLSANAQGGGDALVITGGVAIEVQQSSGPSTAQLIAQRAVVFLNEGTDSGATRFGIDEINGVYLEGDVAISMVRGPDARAFRRATVRGSSVFYDLRTDRAIMLDAVFWTYDAARSQPLYLRADAIRQEAFGQWSAKKATLANVDFAEPHFSIGVDSVMIKQIEQTDGGARLNIEADDVTFRAGSVPLAYLPKVRGDFKPAPLRRLSFASDDGAPVVRSEWDLYSLLGIDAGESSRADLLLDAYLSRGVGVGVDANWRSSRARGGLLAYTIHDQGRDRLTSGETIDRDGEQRTVLAGETIWKPDSPWTIYAEASWISDEAVVDAFFENLAETRRPFMTGFYATRIDRTPGAAVNTAITAEFRGTLNDFIVTESELQSAGYVTQKLPELGYHVLGANIFNGILSYYGETRIGAMSLSFSENDVRDQGFKKARDAKRAFGIPPDQSLGHRLRAEGFTESTVLRFDTRHEFEAPLAAGALNVVPFAVARFTAWDTSFDDFNGNNNENQRLWGAIGVRLATTIQRINDETFSDMFDLSRMRHLIEPSLTIWHAGSTIDRADLPVYDESVERIADGTAGRIGLRNTWQTMRGPIGEERSVDWLMIDTAIGWSSSDVDPRSPLPDFFEARPENANLGRFARIDSSLLLTDAVALVGGVLYDSERGTTARAALGFRIDHGYGYGSYAEYRFLDEPGANEVATGMRYELTRKYAAEAELVYELDSGRAQQFTIRMTRLFPQWTLSVAANIDDIADRVGIGFSLRPVGFAGQRRERVLTLEDSPADVATGRRRTLAPRFKGGPFGR